MTGLFFDTETTGIKSWSNPGFKPKLVQLGAILQDLDTGRVLAEVNLINVAAGEIPVEASNVHGITDTMAGRWGVPLDVIDNLFAHLVMKAKVIVAHNIAYDLDIVKDNLPETQDAMQGRQQFCTMYGSIYIVKAPLSDKQRAYFASHPEKQDAPYKVPNLTETFKHFYGKPFEGAHDAMADIRACRDIFVTLTEQGYYKVQDDGKVIKLGKYAELESAA